MDLSDERFHRTRVPWRTLTKDGYEPKQVLLAAQNQGLWKLAASAEQRIRNQSRDKN